MRLGIFAKTFDGTSASAVLAAVAAAGYSTAQYNMACSGLPSMPDEIPAEAAAAVAAASRRCTVSIAAVSGTYNMIHPDKAVRGQGHRRLEVLASRCKLLSAGMITLCTGTRDPQDQWRWHRDNDGPGAWRDLLASMETAIAIAERWDVTLGIEPELANVVSSPERAAVLISELQSPRLKIVIDPANLFEQASLDEQRHIVASSIDLLGDRIAMGHAKDRTAGGGFVAAGKGVVDFAHYVACLKGAGFDGPMITHGLSAAEAPGVAKFLRDAGVDVL